MAQFEYATNDVNGGVVCRNTEIGTNAKNDEMGTNAKNDEMGTNAKNDEMGKNAKNDKQEQMQNDEPGTRKNVGHEGLMEG